MGKENLVVDALFRQDDTIEIGTLWAISTPLVNWVEQLKESYTIDTKIQEILQ